VPTTQPCRIIGLPPAACPKASSDDTDFLLVGVSNDVVIERLRPAHKPSAETSIHRADLPFRFRRRAHVCMYIAWTHAIAVSRVPAAMTMLPPAAAGSAQVL